MKTFSDVAGDVVDFSYNDPKECYEYPCDDALATYNLASRLAFVYKEMPNACRIDNDLLEPVRTMEDFIQPIDLEWVEHLEKRK